MEVFGYPINEGWLQGSVCSSLLGPSCEGFQARRLLVPSNEGIQVSIGRANFEMDMRHSIDDGYCGGVGRFFRRMYCSIGACVFEMEVRLKGFGENITRVVPAFYSPNSHHVF